MRRIHFMSSSTQGAICSMLVFDLLADVGSRRSFGWSRSSVSGHSRSGMTPGAGAHLAK